MMMQKKNFIGAFPSNFVNWFISFHNMISESGAKYPFVIMSTNQSDKKGGVFILGWSALVEFSSLGGMHWWSFHPWVEYIGGVFILGWNALVEFSSLGGVHWWSFHPWLEWIGRVFILEWSALVEFSSLGGVHWWSFHAWVECIGGVFILGKRSLCLTVLVSKVLRNSLFKMTKRSSIRYSLCWIVW